MWKNKGRIRTNLTDLLSFASTAIGAKYKTEEESSDLRDSYLPMMLETLFCIYAHAWRSGPFVHHHTTDKGYGLYRTKNFRNSNSDDHKAMTFAVRVLAEGKKLGADSYESLEGTVYNALNGIVDWEHYSSLRENC